MPNPLAEEPKSRAEATKFQRFRILIAVVCGALFAAALAPIAASAAPHTCNAEDVCLFESTNWAADPVDLDLRINPKNAWQATESYYANMFKAFPSPHTYNNPESCNQIHALQPNCNLNDTASSARNKDASYKVRLFMHANYSGSYQTLAPLSSDGVLNYENETSSLCWLGGSITVSNCKN